MFLLILCSTSLLLKLSVLIARFFFVKDHGVYVMAAKGEKNSNGMHNVCYANGFNPDTTDFDELWDRMRDACGGDDFCESLDLDPRSIELLSRTKPCLKIMLSETELEVIAGGQK
ncbi:DUF3085 domain-containing protein [Klebsiella pneumoniae subsp. pneumoniae]|nr:DUF3085 domain-containing protein [Klebsiella pneumoniae subsp. pneumoniae]